jgi:hypothetical protein
MIKIFVLCFVLFIVACKRDGTETGNPLPGSATNASSYLIVESACRKVLGCNDLFQLSACIEGQLSIDSFGEKFGLAAEQQQWTLFEIMMAEIEGTIQSNNSQVQLCISEVTSLSCSDSAVQQSYIPSADKPYQNLYQVLPQICQNAFSP